MGYNCYNRYVYPISYVQQTLINQFIVIHSKTNIYDLRKHYFTNRVVPVWNSLPNNVVMAENIDILAVITRPPEGVLLAAAPLAARYCNFVRQVSHSGCFVLLSVPHAYMNDLDIDLVRNTPWVDMSACVKFRVDRPSCLAGHTEQTNRQTDKHNAFYYTSSNYPSSLRSSARGCAARCSAPTRLRRLASLRNSTAFRSRSLGVAAAAVVRTQCEQRSIGGVLRVFRTSVSPARIHE